MEKTNFEKIKELKNWELAQIMDLVALHVDAAVPAYPDAQVTSYDYQREQLKWLNQPYDEKKGFKFILDEDGEETYVTLQDMKVNYEKQIFKGLIKKEDQDVSKQTSRTLGSKFIGIFLTLRNGNGREVEFFAEDGFGYTYNPSEAGLFNLEQVEHFNASIMPYAEFLKNKQEIKHNKYIALSLVDIFDYIP